MGDIKLFRTNGDTVEQLEGTSVALEKSLQELIEKHLETFLAVRFLASEYSTGKTHAGRIDTLGIDENGLRGNQRNQPSHQVARIYLRYIRQRHSASKNLLGNRQLVEPGLYDHLLTEAIEDEIARLGDPRLAMLAPVDSEEAHSALAQFLERLIAEQFGCVSRG